MSTGTGYAYSIGDAADIADDVKVMLDCPFEPGGLASPVIIEGGIVVGCPGWEWDDYWELITDVSELMEIALVHSQRPENLSRAMYGTAELWPILLRLNGCETRADFRGPVLRVIRRESLYIVFDILNKVKARALARSAYVYEDLTIRSVRY